MKLKWIVLLVLAALAEVGGVVEMMSQARIKIMNGKDMTSHCTDGNTTYLKRRAEEMFKGILRGEDIDKLSCIKTAYSSDLFASGEIAKSVDLSSLSLEPGVDWHQETLKSALKRFPEFATSDETKGALSAIAFTRGSASQAFVFALPPGKRLIYFET